MDLPQNFANVTVAQKVAHHLYPHAQSITMIEHSYDNIVALVDASYAVRFPRNTNAYLRGLYEKHILTQLADAKVKTVTIPRILGEHTDPPYLITSFVPGHHVSPADIRALSKDQQRAFATAVARFAYTMHTAFVLDEELAQRKSRNLTTWLPEGEWGKGYDVSNTEGYQ